ncbi:MAG: polyprenyl synthetase family protein [Candidatus Diapherotrites archaeon]
MTLDAMDIISEKKKAIDKELENVFPKSAKFWVKRALGEPKYCYDTKTIQEGLTDQVWEFLNRGGKRWRPALMISACKALNGPEELAVKFAPLIEFVHEGTLLVDDVEDNADLRRGKPAMHKIYGIDCAVNTGNAMYFIPLEILYNNKYNLPEKKIIKIYNIYAQEMLRLSVGQAMDIWWHKGKSKVISESAYLQMCAYKTGVLARFAAKLGAVLANAKKTQIEALGNFGEALGVAFQIQDDILNIAPKSTDWGKEIGEDISEGKRTLLVIKAFQNLPKKEAEELEQILNLHTKDKDKILRAIALIKKSGAIYYSINKARTIVKKAWAKIDKKIPNNDGKQELKAFADFAINRDI